MRRGVGEEGKWIKWEGVERRQEMKGSGCVEDECENGKQVCIVVSFIPPSPTQHILQHHNTIQKKVLLIAYFQQCLV